MGAGTTGTSRNVQERRRLSMKFSMKENKSGNLRNKHYAVLGNICICIDYQYVMYETNNQNDVDRISKSRKCQFFIPLANLA